MRENDGAQAKAAPVRTIWSRDTDRPAKSPAATDNKPAQRLGANGAGSLQPTSTAATATRAPKAPAETPGEPALPHFRIAPEVPDASVPRASIPEPSRLGGPLPLLAPHATEQPSVPTARAHFKEVIQAPAGATAAVPSDCSILAASYGGKKTLLVRAKIDGTTQYTALTVLDGFEKSMFDIYAKSSATSTEIIGEYASKDEALADARANCANR